MQLTINQFDNVAMIDLPESITMANADELKASLQAAIDEGHAFILFNMTHVEFVDSSGLAVLVGVYKKLKAFGKLALLSPCNNVRALMELTRLHEIFDIYEDADNAISDLQAAA